MLSKGDWYIFGTVDQWIITSAIVRNEKEFEQQTIKEKRLSEMDKN